MSTGLLEQRQQYRTGYEYGPFKGETDHDNNGKKEIDCSGLLYRMLKDAGYTIPYLTTSGLNTDTTYFDVIPLAEVQPGDIALWINFHGHTGVIEDISGSPVRDRGNFFGSQSSNGPKSAKYGAGSGYWPMPEKFLRPRPQFRGAQPAPAPNPAPAPAPAGPAPLMSFQYPFRKPDGKQFTGADEVYKVLESEVSGHYLLGSNKFWHGGLHVSNASAPQCVLDEPLRCMADGEVVAYRLNKEYLESPFDAGGSSKKLKYSNSFCLVRHEYKSAPNPEEGANKGKQNKLTFYSLYMHLLPFDRYPIPPEEAPKPKVTMQVNDFKAYDELPVSSSIVSVGKLNKDSKLEILDQSPVAGTDRIYAKGKIISGSVQLNSQKTREIGSEVWFAYLKAGEPYKNNAGDRVWLEEKLPERERPTYWQGKVHGTVVNKLPLFGAPSDPTNGKPAGASLGALQLMMNSVVAFDSQKVLNLVVGPSLQRMAECTLVSGGPVATGNVPPTFWACVENTSENNVLKWSLAEPASVDTVLNIGVGIKAGDPVGYLGQMENVTEAGEVSSKFQAHIEIFTADTGIEDFLNNTAALKVGRQYLYLAKNSLVKLKAPATGEVSLKELHVVELSKAPIYKDTQEWYEINVIDEGQNVVGLVRKAGATLISQHDWAKLGFQIVEESNAAADGFLDPNDMPVFFKRLFEKIDKDNNKEIDASELADALKDTDTRSQWSKLVAKHPTEWKDRANQPKWARLDDILEHSPKLKAHEKERIDKFIFWDELSGKASVESSLVWHFHPIEFIAGFTSSAAELISFDQMKKMFPDSTDQKREEVRGLFNKYADRFEINTAPKMAQFFAQVKTEVGSALVGKVEDLWYSAEALRSKFGRYFNTYPAEAELYGYKRITMAQYNALSPAAKSAYTIRKNKAYSQFPNEDEIAKRIYCCNSVQGGFVLTAGGCEEGKKYKGKGFIQLTWKSNYQAVEDRLKQKIPEETIEMVSNPDQLLDTKIGLLSAMGFWDVNNINNLVAPNTDSTNKITEVVNKHTDSYAERRTNFTAIYQELNK
ncbi:hypothetical protein [Pseudomonas hamedanensis]|uniref:EF-hand domain-containing protein n=1 Tax=Pseudomonas hamedanensis TaxID=2745504 RepID=A0A9E6NXV1_9PSED|nr:hypothetical protein [Pseudomonas hamedanensis]QXI15883.1 hypothetical protein HU739_018415 [Pseudomonas hamedanensis]